MVSAGLLTLPAHAAGSSRHVLTNVHPSWATRSADQGSLTADAVITGRVYLASRDAGGLTRFVTAVSTPGSALYHQYLTPAAARARFGSRPGAAGDVAAWVRSTGLTVTKANSHYVAFRGSAAKVGAAFGTSIHSFVVGGKNVHAPAGQASVPSSIARDVLTVDGLSSQLVANHPMLVQSAKPMDEPVPCNAYEGEKFAKKFPKAYGATQPFAVCGYEPKQLRGAYGTGAKGFTGKGITMAVVDGFAQPTMTKDLKTWVKNRGEAPLAKGQYKEYIPEGTTYNEGWGGEEALDIEAIHAMAPDAKIVYVAAKTPSDNFFYDAFTTIIDKHLADAVNNSWEGGTDTQEPQGTIDAYENLFKMGAAEGIGFYFSSGDSGGAGGTTYPSIDPYVTAVGGSAVGIDKQNTYMWETSWETDYAKLSGDGKSWVNPPGTFTSGAGGGTSMKFKQPKWQKGVVPKKFSEIHGGAAMRTSPDIGADADPTTGFLEGYSTQVSGKFVYGELRIGGTSLSSPLIVGMQAVAEQASGGDALGFANPAIYARYGSRSYNDVTDDPFGDGTRIAHVRTATLDGVSQTALATAGNAKDAHLAAVKGYDTTTGVGTPTVSYFKSFQRLP
jgi:subtilase family serine protease